MNEENKDFKVVDKRSSSTSAGEGFVMKEAPKSETPPARVPASQIDFSTLVLSLATGALIHLGLTPDPTTQKTEKNIELAKQNIDILSLLKEKTKGNVTAEEEKLIENLLTETRLRFVEVQKR